MRAVIGLFALAILLLAAGTAVVVLGSYGAPEIILTLLLIMGVVVLLAALGGLVALLRQWGLIDRREALGLPAGSIRAVIALGLIIIFAMASVFLVGAAERHTVELPGLTAEQVAALPVDRLTGTFPGGDSTYTAILQSPSDFSDDISQQLLTVLGTLVTAVVAFYFGSATVTAGRAERPEPPPLDPETAEAMATASAAAREADAASVAVDVEGEREPG